MRITETDVARIDTLSATTTIDVRSASALILWVKSSSSLSGSFTVSFDNGTTFTTYPVTNKKTGVTDADGASMSFTTNDVYYIVTQGVTHVKFTLSIGTGEIIAKRWFDSPVSGNVGGSVPQPVLDSFNSAVINASANTANQSLISAPGASKQIWVYGFFGTAGTGDGSISLQDEDDTALSGVMPVAANGGLVVPMSGNMAQPWFKVATNKALEVDTVTCTFKGTIVYGIVSV